MAYVKNGQPAQGSTHPKLGDNESANGVITHRTIGEAVFDILIYIDDEIQYCKI